MSATELLVRYLAERSRLRVLVPLAALLAAAAWRLVPNTRASAAGIAATGAQAFLFVLAFRVWDDLEDRDRDIREHPERVMVVSGRRLPFVALAISLGAIGLVSNAFLPAAATRVAVLAAASATLVLWYRLRGRRQTGIIGEHVVLLKYPAIALAMAPSLAPLADRPTAWRAAAVLVSLYLTLCVYESFDDPALRGSSAARRIAVSELIVLVPLITAALFGVGLP